MHICVLVGDVKALKPRFGSVHLAWSAHRRGHDVRFVSVDDLSYLDDNSILGTTTRARAGDYARPADYLEALRSSEAVRDEEALARFDVVFLRYNPLTESAAHAGSPVIDLCWRLRLGGTLVINDPEGVRRAGSGMYLADLPAEVRVRALVSRSRAAAARVPARARQPGGAAGALALAAARRSFTCAGARSPNVNQMISALTKEGYAVAQEYLPEAEHGEKRILLLGGEPIRMGSDVAIYRRVPLLRGGLTDTVVETPGWTGPAQALRLRAGRGAAVRDPRAPSCWPTGSTSSRSTWSATKFLDSTCSRPSGLRSLSEIYGVEVGDIVVRDLERRVRLRAAYRTTFDPEAADIV